MGYADLIHALRALQPTDQEGALAYLGFTPPGGTYTIPVAGQPGKVWVRIVQGDTRTVDQARNYRVPLIPDLPVRVGMSTSKPVELEVLDFDSSAWSFLGAEAPGLVAPHSHEPGYGMEDPVSPRRLKMGLVHATNPPSLSVYIEPFHFTYQGEGKYWPGGSLDLTSNRPSGVGQWAWAKVGINPATNLATAAAGSDTSIYVPLTEADLAAVSFAGYLALAGVKLRSGQTSIASEWDFADCTPWRSGVVNTSSWLKHNLTATTAPGVGDDTADGYSVGSLWVNTADETAYLCADPAAGAAVWLALGGASGGDMLRSVYDTDADGIVDNAEALQGHPASDFAAAAHTHDTHYFTEGEYIVTSSGASDAGKPVKTGVDGKLASSLLPAASGGEVALSDLVDVDVIPPPTTGQVLVWDNTNSVWKPGTVSSSGGSGPFTPASIQGLFGWYDASAITGVADGATVEQWSDQSSNGAHAVQTTASSRPVYRSAGLNGLPCLEFDGTRIMTMTQWGPKINPVSFAAVYTLGTARQCMVVHSSIYDGLNGGNCGIGYYSPTLFVPRGKYNSSNGLCFTASSFPVLFDASAKVVTTSYSINDNGIVTLNGARIVENYHDGWGMNSVTDRSVGWQFIGKISEVLIYDGYFTPKQAADLTTYLTTKWAIS